MEAYRLYNSLVHRRLILLALAVWACGPAPNPSLVPSASPSVAVTASVEPNSSAATESAEPTESAGPTAEPTAAPTPEPTPTVEPVVTRFSGNGTHTSDEFPLRDGDYRVTWLVTNGPCTVDFTLLQKEYKDRYPVGHVATNDAARGHFELALLGGWYKLEVKGPGCKWTVDLVQR